MLSHVRESFRFSKFPSVLLLKITKNVKRSYNAHMTAEVGRREEIDKNGNGMSFSMRTKRKIILFLICKILDRFIFH